MSVGRGLAWLFVLVLGGVPLNWVRLWMVGDVPHDATWTQFLIGTLVCWAIAGGLGYFLVMSARGAKLRQAQIDEDRRALMEAPLTEVKPVHALIKSDEKAYCAIKATLQEIKTVGYSAGSAGVSVRVAKGVTLRTGRTRGTAVKGMVTVATGELVMTDRRVIFAGDFKSFAIAIEDLLGTTEYSDGFGFSDSKSTYNLMTDDQLQHQRFAVVMAKLLHGSSTV